MSVILDPSGKGKMSKRKKVVAGKEYLALVHEFEEAGYLPDALFNFLTNIGWNFGDEQEIFSRQEAIERFDLAELNPSPAALPYAKLEWMNGIYIRDMDLEQLAEELVPFLSRDLGIDQETLYQDSRLPKLIPLIQERLKVLTEATEKIDWAFKTADEITYPEPKLLIGKKLDAAQSLQVLEKGIDLIERAEPFSAEALEELFRAAAAESDLKVGSFFAPFRVAITGKTVAPPLFESMVVLGRDEVLLRVRNGAEALRTYAAELA
jgi:glutamyl-tRNA synthetase